MSNSFLTLFKKEWLCANRSRRSLKKSDVSDLLLICSFALKKRAIRSKQIVVSTKFFTVFHLFMPKSDSILLLFTKERPWAIRSHRSLQFKKDWNRTSLFEKEWNTISTFRSQKTSDSLEKPKSEFSTLPFLQIILVQNSICPTSSSDDLCLLFCIYSSSMLRRIIGLTESEERSSSFQKSPRNIFKVK